MTEATLTDAGANAAPDTTLTSPPAASSTGLVHRRGRWIDGWDPEEPRPVGGSRHARSRSATWSGRSSPSSSDSWSGSCGASSPSSCRRPASRLDSSQIFWLISIPSLVGATLRIPYSFLVPIFGGRNWTIISAGLLLIPGDRDGDLRRQPRDAVPGAASGRGPRRLRRRQLRQLDVEHHLLLPAAREGLGARASTPPAATSAPRSRSSSFRSS